LGHTIVPTPKIPLSPTPFISILIPARNEAGKIEQLLSDLLTFNYPNLEILVYNDQSTDRTEEIVKQFTAEYSSIRLINGDELPKNWLGKNFGCHHLAVQAKGEYLLFLDADVRVKNGLLERSITYTEKHQLSLLSIFPKQVMRNFGTRLSVPLMNWILLSLLPLQLVRLSSWRSFSAANGQFMLFRASTYRELLPHQQFKEEKVEDIAIIRHYKEKRLKVATLLGDDGISCKMYNSLEESINGFSKNIIQFFGGSITLTLVFAFCTTIAPFYLFYLNGFTTGLLYLICILFIRIFISLASKQSLFENVMLIALQHITFLRIIFKALVHKRNKSIVWKDRKIE
jgi:glycosyltransferase involved in cell wall biosynthesis